MTYLIANWPAPKNVRALTTTRFKGFSQGPYAANNLALHVEDDPEDVARNRAALRQQLHLPHEPLWLDQTHSNRCVRAKRGEPIRPDDKFEPSTSPTSPLTHPARDVLGEVDRAADAAVTSHPQVPLAILTADCLPIVLCNQTGTEIAAIHAGWRGLVSGIIENTCAQMTSPADTCIAWIGPAICGRCYATGQEVFEQFKARYAEADQAFFYQKGHLHADLAYMAEQVLLKAGVCSVTQSNVCTFESPDYYSYRKAAQTGRIATLIWFDEAFPPKKVRATTV